MRKRVGAWLSAAVFAAATVACSQTDAGITTAVKSKLAADDTVKAYRIDVDTSNAVVTLNGQVDTARARARAVELAKATNGVRDVVDNLSVVAGVTPPGGLDDAAMKRAREAAARDATTADADTAKRADADTGKRDTVGTAGSAVGDAALTAKVKTKFLADTSISGLKIDVDTKNDVVTLSGTVPTAAEKRHAVEVARATDGVKSVVDNLKVGK
jgi:hyperosmotically inducible periplasmic protein